jgi:flavin reductase (DIM6/NTAB) family NADH-FMN oxidoreductase RutF
LDTHRSFRDVLGRYPTGVVIVTAFVDGKPLGVTVNSFASVSLDPPLVLWSVDRETDRYEIFAPVEHYAINILAHDQADLAHACALSADLIECRAELEGEVAPLIIGAVARLVCKREAVHPGGDHDIIVGRVTQQDAPRDEASLLFYRGAYGRPG